MGYILQHQHTDNGIEPKHSYLILEQAMAPFHWQQDGINIHRPLDYNTADKDKGILSEVAIHPQIVDTDIWWN